ncbi:PfkB family carbohydrate kinase [Lentzea cavernae]|nr:PfkB family carbohydrate kinase [Lentzea cavernae]
MSGVDGVRSVLVRLRTRSGLSADRLRSTEVDVEPVLELPIVRQVVRTTGASAPEAAVEAIRVMAGQLGTTDLVVVDVVLSLGIIEERFAGTPGLADLYAADVGERRRLLVDRWAELHDLLGESRPPKPPTVRTLRLALEAESLNKLAELCVGSSVLDATAAEADHSRPTVTVIGSAVMDFIFLVDHLPTASSAAPTDVFEESPGGKGLNHAIASARLGMDVHLVAAVGDDDRGRQLLDYLVAEGVRINLIKMTAGRNPVVAVFLLRNGGSANVPWMNAAEVRLDPLDVSASGVRAVLESTDAVVLTFEAQAEVVSSALDSIGNQARKPLVVVRPSPALPNPQVLYEHFSKIDYLIGTQAELRDLLPSAKRDITVEELAQSLLTLGVHGVCITEEFGCLIRSEYIQANIAQFPAAMRDTPGAREAFSAALILKLLEKNRKIDERDLKWATAAMAASQSYGGVADSMPAQEQVDRVVGIPGARTS